MPGEILKTLYSLATWAPPVIQHGGGVHVVSSRHVRLRLASLKPRQSLLPLVRRSLRGLPNLTPRSLARFLPSPVRARINSRSNSAKPPRTVSIKRPCGLVVSGVLQRFEARATLRQGFDDVQQVPAIQSRLGVRVLQQAHLMLQFSC